MKRKPLIQRRSGRLRLAPSRFGVGCLVVLGLLAAEPATLCTRFIKYCSLRN